MSLGFSKEVVTMAYILCEKDMERTATYLFEH